jgi:hypothetical protein
VALQNWVMSECVGSALALILITFLGPIGPRAARRDVIYDGKDVVLAGM